MPKSRVVLTVEEPKDAGERIANSYDPSQFMNLWLARRWFAKELRRELEERDRAILSNVKDYLGGTNND